MGKKGRKLFNGLFWQISIVFIVVLLVFTIITSYISVQGANKYAQEVNQNLNHDLAANTVAMMSQYIEDGVINQEGVKDLVHSMMVINPNIEVYLLDQQGVIKSYVAPEKVVKLDRIDMKAVEQFLSDDKFGTVYGDDPRTPGVKKIFSAAPIIQNNELTGYIYIVLASQEYVTASHLVFGSYILGLSLKSITIILIISALVGLLAFWFLVKKLNGIINGIRAFQKGNLKSRVAVKNESELDKIAIVFNDMADTIEQNIEELKGIDTLRKELISNISHDLRTPIASIQGYAETLLIKSDKLNENERLEYLEIIYKSCERLKKLVSDLFELSKLESNQVKLNAEPFSITELVHDIANKYRLLSENKGVHINTMASREIPFVQADISMIDRVIQNLMDNALRFCNEGDTVTIELNNLSPEEVKVRISDTGKGIKKDQLPHIFERYFKSSEYEQSTGLGLAIVKKIIDLHNKNIEVESLPGKGTTFIFSLPVLKTA